MQRYLITLFLLILTILPVEAQNIFENMKASNGKNIFVYHIPDEEEVKKEEPQQQDIISDDVTADTSPVILDYNLENLNMDETYDEVEDMYSCVLKGYAQYNEEDQEAIALEIPIEEIPIIAIKKPKKISSEYFSGVNVSSSLYDSIYTKFDGTEYAIAPLSVTTSNDIGKGFSAGTTYSQVIDYGELEQSSGIFSKYQYKNFAISTSFAKTVNTTNNTYNDNFYIIPEFKLNQYFTLKNILSADTVKKRKKAEIVLSFNPFGKRDFDRMRIEIGANETYDDMNNLLKNQFKFSTNFNF